MTRTRKPLTPEALTMLPRLLLAAERTGTFIPDGVKAQCANALMTGVSDGWDYTVYESGDQSIISNMIFAGAEGKPPNEHSLVNGIICILYSGKTPEEAWLYDPKSNAPGMLKRIREALERYASDASDAPATSTV